MAVIEDGQESVRKTYVVEHLDPELRPWSTLEYIAIAEECSQTSAKFYLSSVPASLDVPNEIRSNSNVTIENGSAEELFSNKKHRVCLLDPAASIELSPSDASEFDVFLFGGILGTHYDNS